jgi:hypothetical protein
MAEKLHARPSALLELTGYEAYCLDQALMYMAGEIEQKMEQVGKGVKDADKAAAARSRWLTKFIGGPDAAVQVKGQFKDPASMM